MGLFVFAVVLSSLSVAIYAIADNNPSVLTLMRLSDSTPWGIVTAIVAHGDTTHLGLNLGGILYFTIAGMFALSVDSISKEQARFRFRLLLTASLVAAIIANILWLELPNRAQGSLGASGVVYAMLGITTMFLLIDILKQSSEYKLRNIPLGKFVHDSMRSLVFAGPVVGIAVFNVDMFLSAAPQSNVFVHGTAFLIGVVVVMVFEYVPLMWNILKFRTAYS